MDSACVCVREGLSHLPQCPSDLTFLPSQLLNLPPLPSPLPQQLVSKISQLSLRSTPRTCHLSPLLWSELRTASVWVTAVASAGLLLSDPEGLVSLTPFWPYFLLPPLHVPLHSGTLRLPLPPHPPPWSFCTSIPSPRAPCCLLNEAFHDHLLNKPSARGPLTHPILSCFSIAFSSSHRPYTVCSAHLP